MPRSKPCPLDHQRLLHLLDYDPETGIFRWRERRSRKPAGSIAGHENKLGYIVIRIDQRHYFAHRLAWFYVNRCMPKSGIDHKNLRKDDNRWDNLRPASDAQQRANTTCRSDNQCGYKGVRLDSKSGHTPRWSATIRVDQRRIRLGTFGCPEAAHAAYVEAAKLHYGEFARA